MLLFFDHFFLIKTALISFSTGTSAGLIELPGCIALAQHTPLQRSIKTGKSDRASWGDEATTATVSSSFPNDYFQLIEINPSLKCNKQDEI